MRKKTLTAVLIAGWLAAMASALWWYQGRYIRTFSDSATLFSGAALQLPARIGGFGKVRLVHFWEPSCPCNAGNQQHLAEMMQEYGAAVDFYHVQKAGTSGRLPRPLQAMQPLGDLHGADGLPASPAVAIFDRSGTLAYFGPYSEGAVCTSSNSFIEPVLDALLQGRPVAAASTLAAGCFCDWRVK